MKIPHTTFHHCPNSPRNGDRPARAITSNAPLLFHQTGWFSRSFLFALVLSAFTLASSLQATVLTFKSNPDFADDAALPSNYGNRVAAGSVVSGGNTFQYGNFGEGFTPNVTATYDNAANTYGSGYGALVNVVYAPGGIFRLTLTGDTGFNVSLFSFDLAGLDASYQINSVSVFSGATTLFTQSNVTVSGSSNGTGVTSFNFGPLTAHTLTVQFDATNQGVVAQQNIGIDNIRFSQVAVPEPSVTALVTSMAGLTYLLHRRRSRK